MQEPKMGGQAVTRLLIMGNQDLKHSLLSKEDGGMYLANGLKEAIEVEQNGRFQLSVEHVPAGRIETLLQQIDRVHFPEGLKEQGLDSEFIKAQFNNSLFTTDADILIMSIQADLIHDLWQNNDDEHYLSPPSDWELIWNDSQKLWFTQNYTFLGRTNADTYKENLTKLVQALKEKTTAHIMMLGCSTFDPKEEPHNLYGREVSLTEQTHRLNLVLLELSFSEGVTFIDVDRLLAEIGCRQHVSEPLHYSNEAYASIRDDVKRVISDVGFFEERPLLVQMGHRSR